MRSLCLPCSQASSAALVAGGRSHSTRRCRGGCMPSASTKTSLVSGEISRVPLRICDNQLRLMPSTPARSESFVKPRCRFSSSSKRSGSGRPDGVASIGFRTALLVAFRRTPRAIACPPPRPPLVRPPGCAGPPTADRPTATRARHPGLHVVVSAWSLTTGFERNGPGLARRLESRLKRTRCPPPPAGISA